MSLTQATLDANLTANQPTLHLALELSKSKWVVAFSDGLTKLSKARLVTIDAKKFKRLWIRGTMLTFGLPLKYRAWGTGGQDACCGRLGGCERVPWGSAEPRRVQRGLRRKCV